MAYVPAYPSRINWENEPSDATALNDVNLNKMDYAIYQHDQALIAFDGRISTLEGESYVNSFNGRTGAVSPAQDDYTIDQIKATGTAGQYVTLDSNGKLNLTTLPAYPTAGHIVVNSSGTSMTQRSKMKFTGSVSITDDSTNDQTIINITGGGGGGSGHTILDPSGSSMTQRTNLQFAGTGVTVSDNANDDKTVVTINGGGSSGHTIKDGDGTAMNAQPNLQFVDAKVTNDAQGQATKVQNFVDIDWDDWQNVGDSDDTYYRVLNAPLADGTVEADLMEKLWENSAPNASFTAQNITLGNLTGYSFYVVTGRMTASSSGYLCSQFIPVVANKAHYPSFTTLDNTTIQNYTRAFTITDIQTGTVAVSICYKQSQGSAQASDNSYFIPLAIYGVKQKVSISLSAIAKNVLTDADHCMLDENTSVADALTYSETEHVVGVWIDGKTLYEKTVNIGALPNATTKVTAHGISNLSWIESMRGVCFGSSTYLPLPFIDNSALTNNIRIDANQTNISVRTSGNYSAFSGYVTLRYTKTT